MATQYPDNRAWYLRNKQTNEVLKGQFEPLDLTKEVGSNWAEHTTLNRRNSILMFLNGKTDTISFNVRMYALHSGHSIITDLATLESWCKADTSFGGKPPVLLFWVGDQHVMMTCVMEELSGIKFGRPTEAGGLREVTATVKLKQYTPFSLDDTEEYETRYAHARERDYYELLCQQEYGNALLGDVIRKRHPSQPSLNVNSIVKLPSIEAIRREVVKPDSISLDGAFSKKSSPQRDNRIDMFAKRNRIYTSHTVVAV